MIDFGFLNAGWVGSAHGSARAVRRPSAAAPPVGVRVMCICIRIGQALPLHPIKKILRAGFSAGNLLYGHGASPNGFAVVPPSVRRQYGLGGMVVTPDSAPRLTGHRAPRAHAPRQLRTGLENPMHIL
jgi:hypothetical protein